MAGIQPVVPFEEDVYEDGLEVEPAEVVGAWTPLKQPGSGNRKQRRDFAKAQSRQVRQAYGLGVVTDPRRRPGFFVPPALAPKDKQ